MLVKRESIKGRSIPGSPYLFAIINTKLLQSVCFQCMLFFVKIAILKNEKIILILYRKGGNKN